MLSIISTASKPTRTNTISNVPKASPKQTRRKAINRTTPSNANAKGEIASPQLTRSTISTSDPAADDRHEEVHEFNGRESAIKAERLTEHTIPRRRSRVSGTTLQDGEKNGRGPIILKEKGSVIIHSNKPGKSSLQLPGDPTDHVSKYLDWAVGKHYAGKSLGDTSRMNIVSEDLCGDILHRLQPSLRKHVGCDVIDINPGAGIWSSKLHDFLKPRTHILVEPDASAYEPLLKPLLERPDSKFKLIRKSGIIWPHLESVLTEEDLPAQEVLKNGDSRLNEPNNTLLVTANLGYNPKKTFRGFESVAHLVVYQFIRAIRSHELFHRYGQIRMLLWIDDAEKKLILRRSIGRRRKQDIEFEALCQITEIASSTDYLELDKEYGKYGRPITLDLEGTRQVLKKMQQRGITTPKNRESLTMEYMADYDAGQLDQSRKSARHKKFEKLYESGELPKTIVDENGRTKPNPDWSALIRHRYHEGWKAKQEVHRTELIEEYEALLSEQLRIFAEDQTSPDIEFQKVEYHRRYEKWQDRMDHLYIGERYGVRSIVDNIAAFKANPPLLPWDRREFEPLKAQPTEFFPENTMALLDVQPSAPWPMFQEDPDNSFHAFEYIIAPLFRAPAQNLPRALKSLYPGAFEAIVPECPSLTDPTKGGVLDVSHLLVKNLTIEMIQEICSAWMKWPFRPSKYEMIFQSGSSLAEDPDAYERTEEADE